MNYSIAKLKEISRSIMQDAVKILDFDIFRIPGIRRVCLNLACAELLEVLSWEL